MTTPAKTIELALQGGGAHGALAWGVLDRLLGEPDLRIEGVSGTNARAMNAVVLADGLEAGGPQTARRRPADGPQTARRRPADGPQTARRRPADGPQTARAALARLWKAVSDAALASPIQRSLWDRLSGN